MSVTVLALGSIRLLVPTVDELELVGPPDGAGVIRTITRYRFDNHDTSGHTPTLYVREASVEKITNETPELWRVQIPRVVAANASDEDCGAIALLGNDQSLTVILAAAPSDLEDDQKWPAVTVWWIDQLITRTAPNPVAHADGLEQALQVALEKTL